MQPLARSEQYKTVPIDTSGEPLYKRSKRPFNGKAPIRENYGAALCFSLKKEIDLKPLIFDSSFTLFIMKVLIY